MSGKIKILEPNISNAAIDHRGAIYSYIPTNNIVEFVYLYTKAGETRGHHYHSEFDEYIMLVNGEGIYFELLDNGSKRKILMAPGQTIYIPSGTAHTFMPLTDCKSVSFLTKKWDDCRTPITKVNL